MGYLAQQFKAQVRLTRLKFESAVPKFLATIGAIASLENLERTELTVYPILLLPYSEFESSERLETQIRKLGRSFYFRGELVKIKLGEILVVPEGGGFFWEVASRRGSDWVVKQEAICVLMLGHRNVSLLTFTKGGLNSEKSETTDRGFAALVDLAVNRSSGQTRASLTRTIYEVGDDITPDNKLIRASTKSIDSENIKAEAKSLAQAIQAARREYWLFLRDWIDAVIPKRVSELIICGGGAFYLKTELSELLSWAQPTWRSLENKSAQSQLESWPDPTLFKRVADVWAIFESTFIKNPNLSVD